MRSRLISLGILPLIVPLSPGLSQDATTTNTTVIRGYPTPKAVFDANREASRKQDYRTFFACLTSEAQRVCLFETFFASGTAPSEKSAAIKAITDKYIQGNWEEAFKVRYREKFGIDYANARKQQAKNPAIRLPNDTELLAEVLAEHIPDQVGFFSDMSAVLFTHDTSPPLGSDLSNVVINGDTATGQTESQTESMGSDGQGPYRKEVRKFQMTIRFRRTNAGWLLDAN